MKGKIPSSLEREKNFPNTGHNKEIFPNRKTEGSWKVQRERKNKKVLKV